MFASLFNKAETAAHGIARDAGITLLVVVLQFGAMLFVFGGVAWGLSYVMEPPFALALTGVGLGVTAFIVLAVKRNGGRDEEEDEKESESGHSLVNTLGAVAGKADVVATTLFTHQLRRHPVATIAATLAAGALMGMISATGDED